MMVSFRYFFAIAICQYRVALEAKSALCPLDSGFKLCGVESSVSHDRSGREVDRWAGRLAARQACMQTSTLAGWQTSR
jgi:hypothetical protein